MNDYDNDGFSTLLLRASRNSMAATAEGPCDLHFGDALTVVIAPPPGLAAADSVLFGIYAADGSALCAPAAADSVFAWVPGSSDRVYQNVSLNTPAAAALAATLRAAEPAEVRAIASVDGGRVILDLSLRFFSNPHYNNAGAALLPRDYVAKAVVTMPSAPPVAVWVWATRS